MPANEIPFGKYLLLDRIAAGGMAEIFKARYSPVPGVNKQVVIKRILPHYAQNKAFIAMFTNEARIVMGLSHGNIAQVFDYGEIDGDSFIAMELVDGQPLSKIIKRMKAFGIDTMPQEYAVWILIEMLKGLGYAHSRLDETGKPLHIVHRDVSPQNVLVSYESQVKLVDFGIARARHATEDSATGSVKGKYVYFSPEQARGKDLDGRTDLFAAGVILYELLTGTLPFQGKMTDALAAIVKGQFQQPRELNPNIPEALQQIVLKAMAVERSSRYATAEEFQRDLARYLNSSSVSANVQADLALFLELLFEQELVAAGRPVLIPPSFAERVRGWQRRGRDPSEAPTEMNSVPGPPAAPAPPKPLFLSSPHFSGDARAEWAPSRRVIALALVSAIAIGVLGVVLFTRLRKGTLEIVSTPPGATVVLDGKTLNGATPLVVDHLEGGRRYSLELSLAGRQTWRNDVPLRRGQRLLVNATLVALPPPPPPPQPPTPAVEPAPTAPVLDEVRWPAQTVMLDVARHHVDLGAAGATELRLEPAATYRVSLSASTSLGWGAYVVNDAGATPVVFSGQPLQVKGASRLLVFHLPLAEVGGTDHDDAKPRVLTVAPLSKKKALTHPITAWVELPGTARVRLSGLDRASVYEFTPRRSTPPPRLSPEGAPITTLVLGTESGLAVLPFDQPTRVTGTEQSYFTVLENEAAPTGLVAIEVRELPMVGKRR